MCFPVSYAGFFAKSQIMFFLLSSFRFCPPLKNDGTSEWRFQKIFHLFCIKRKAYETSRPCLPEGVRVSRKVRINNTSEEKQKTSPFFRQSFLIFILLLWYFLFSVSDIP